LYSTKDHPIQSFQWADYSAKPGHCYTYTITALKGKPIELISHKEVIISIITEDPLGGNHDVYFNRGIAASQAYIRRFGDKRPKDVPNRKAYEWLSRGLNEALEDFILTCVPGEDSLRIAAYEFNYDDFLIFLKKVIDNGVDIKFVYDARGNPPRDKNIKAVQRNVLNDPNICFKRTNPPSYISHNKFIVKLHNGIPESVWTGGTNFSEGGIYGHSNVAHVVEEPAIAQQYLEYWNELIKNPDSYTLKDRVEEISKTIEGNPLPGTSVLFSPRKNLDLLKWYANLAKEAQKGLFMTFAFGMNDVFQNVYKHSEVPFRVALMDKKTANYRTIKRRKEEEKKIDDLRKMPENLFAIGDHIRTDGIEGWVEEQLSGMNCHVRYIHNKFMLIDPLSEDPIVIAGSANFSEQSTNRNDENMLITRGNKRVADIYLGEFMRLYTHHAFRESLNWRSPGYSPKSLRTDDWWKDYFTDKQRATRRKYFVGTL
jgi:phosphatidylserine/phosphatidylglycerophosphate/cardiolipin synthase-like enzyme